MIFYFILKCLVITINVPQQHALVNLNMLDFNLNIISITFCLVVHHSNSSHNVPKLQAHSFSNACVAMKCAQENHLIWRF